MTELRQLYANCDLRLKLLMVDNPSVLFTRYIPISGCCITAQVLRAKEGALKIYIVWTCESQTHYILHHSLYYKLVRVWHTISMWWLRIVCLQFAYSLQSAKRLMWVNGGPCYVFLPFSLYAMLHTAIWFLITLLEYLCWMYDSYLWTA